MQENKKNLGSLPKIPSVILCGGLGTRIRDINEALPKPMNQIGEKPIIWHIMKLFSYFGYTDTILCLGYKGWMIKEFFLNYRTMTSDVTVALGAHNELVFHSDLDEADWKVTLADTGVNTMTGGRLYKVRRYLKQCDHFFLTYGDGLANINLNELLHLHLKSGLVGTITAVRVAGRFGELEIADGKISAFSEKPVVTESRINGGFMVFDSRRIWDYLNDSEELVLEQEPLNRLVEDKQLGVYEHDGFWQCMDTPREYNLLNSLWGNGIAPWKLWK